VKHFAFAVPGDLATLTGGYIYDRRIIAELAALGWQTQVVKLGEGFPRPSDSVRTDACRQLSTLPERLPIVIDGLALGVLPDAARAVAQSHPLVALVHHPLALETGLRGEEVAAFRTSERAALAHAQRVIATSEATARLLVAEYEVPRESLIVVCPGTDKARMNPRPPRETVLLLAVGAVVPRKGYDVLIAALAKVKELPWRLVIAGDRGRSPETTARIELAIKHHHLADRIEFLGAISQERLAELYSAADLFVLASRFEGYGMAYAEAIAHGLPVIATKAGAIADTVPAGAGVLVPPDDAEEFAEVLRRLIACPDERERLAAGARAASFPTWRESAMQFAQVLDGLA
jgi:glycosyltransferase involved in cell wall biosynthesis